MDHRGCRMRRSIAMTSLRIAALAILLSACGSATSQAAAPAPAPVAIDDRPRDQGALARLERTWPDRTRVLCGVRWSSPGSAWLYDGTMTLERAGIAVRATIDWRLLQADTARFPQLAGRLGDRALERIEGHYDTASRALVLHSVEIGDPALIGAASYRLRVRDDGTLHGETAGADDGIWDGQLECGPLQR